MNACPKCKSTTGYSLRVRTVGYVVHEGEWNGTHERITDDSNMKLIADKTVRCLDCGSRTLMKTLRAATLMLFLFALPLNAQVTQAQYDSVVARVTALEQILGTKFNYPRPTSSIAADLIPANTLPTGQYPYVLSDYQIRVGLAEGFGGLQAQVSGLATRLSAIESSVAGGQPVGTAVFDKIRANKVCIGDYDCNADWNAQLQVRGNYDAIVGLESNKLGTQSQSPRAHIGQVGLSSDGGVRIQQNMMGLFSRGFTPFVDPCRETLNLGPDSRANFSIDRGEVDSRANPFTGEFCTPLPVPDSERTQSLVITTDQASKQITFLVWKPDWSIAFKTSTCKWCMDKVYLVPKQ